MIEDKDYIMQDRNTIKFQDLFVYDLKEGPNYFKIQTHNGWTNRTVGGVFCCIKCPFELSKAWNSYKSIYPEGRYKNVSTNISYANDNTVQKNYNDKYDQSAVYNIESYHRLDKVFIDGVEMDNPSSFLAKINNSWCVCVPTELTNHSVAVKLDKGIHFIEVVINGESQVLMLVKSSSEEEAYEILKQASTDGVQMEGRPAPELVYRITPTPSNTEIPIVSPPSTPYYYVTPTPIVRHTPTPIVSTTPTPITSSTPIIVVSPTITDSSYIDDKFNVKGSFKKEQYLEISFDKEIDLSDNILQMETRCYQEDWSPYEDFKKGKMEIYYDDDLIWTEK